jgi:hypothetical protein
MSSTRCLVVSSTNCSSVIAHTASPRVQKYSTTSDV